MDRKNADIFSPIKNFDEGNHKRRTDSFSKFLKGPDSFAKTSAKTEENVSEETYTVKNISNKDSSKSLQIKSAESECSAESKDASNKDSLKLCSVESSVQSVTDAFPEACRIKEIKNDNQPSSSSQCKKLPQVYSDESSMQSDAAVVPECIESMETDCASLLRQHNPLSQIQSRIEKMVSDALQSQVENIQQIMWSNHYSLLEALHENVEALKRRHAIEREALCKVMEELSTENRQLRDAVSNDE